MAYLGRGNAKLLLFGEHAVVHGYSALGCGLPGSVTASWAPGGGALTLQVPPDYEELVRQAFLRAAASLGILDPRGFLEVRGDIPPGSGFGSSGALCAALARVLFASLTRASGASGANGAADEASRIDELWRAANEAEKLFHGNPSGVDTGLALLGGLQRISPRGTFPPLAQELSPAGCAIVYGAVPRLSSCAANVAAVSAAMRAGDTRMAGAMAELGRLADDACLLFNGGDDVAAPPALGALADEAQAVLRGLGLSTPALEGLLAAGREAGALGGKLSGGGGGGAFWLACANADSARAIAEALKTQAVALALPGDAFIGRLVL
jgi:mevalonate kinase